ncbi:TPA: ADP-ribose pyrophosphatase [Candidatus Gastranaerophilales bacterium HUM_9]|nr:MAG TPA: ADP-ribose pyrophosphatase [Candidatus Gastranaerophilales bacterium HUM_9]HBX34770.1 ADP-ribose pyrophosphatase [Cyanobacteria bacterium UBA11440]
MEFEEKTLSSEYVFRGKVIDVKRDDILVSNGHKSIREVVEHSGGVVILAIKDNKILTVNQFRYPIKTTSIELPAGKLEIGENPDFASKRELEEETGYIAKKWKSLGYIYTSVGFCNEKLYLYLATDLEYKQVNPDEDEIIEAKEYPIKEVFEMIDNGKINDAKTLCALLRAREYIND